MINNTIYVVDDDPQQRGLLKMVLRVLGCENFTIFESSEEVKAAIIKNPPELLISDIGMPKIDGYELCYFIKSSPELSKVKVVLVSALSTDLFVNLAKKSKADAYLTKPWSPDELGALVGQMLDVQISAPVIKSVVKK